MSSSIQLLISAVLSGQWNIKLPKVSSAKNKGAPLLLLCLHCLTTNKRIWILIGIDKKKYYKSDLISYIIFCDLSVNSIYFRVNMFADVIIAMLLLPMNKIQRFSSRKATGKVFLHFIIRRGIYYKVPHSQSAYFAYLFPRVLDYRKFNPWQFRPRKLCGHWIRTPEPTVSTSDRSEDTPTRLNK